MCTQAAKKLLTFDQLFPQIGLVLAYFSITCIGRHGDIALANVLDDASKHLLDLHGDGYILGRGIAVSTLFMGHIVMPLRETYDYYYAAIDQSMVSGDKHQMLLSVGGVATTKFYCGEHLAEVDSYCSNAPEDFPFWEQDLRGGTFLIGCRQAARALQGKTWTDDAENVMTDDDHSTGDYLALVANNSSSADRPRVVYGSFMLLILYIFGHYDKAMQINNEIVPQMSCLWSIRTTRLVYFYASLTIIARLRENPQLKKREDELLEVVGKYKAQIVEWQSCCDANYLMWSLLIEAEMSEVEGDLQTSTQAYESAIDHAQLYDLNLELALALESQGGFFIRRGARRAAVALLKDAMAVYSRIGAAGKVEQMATKHEFLLSSFIGAETQDAAVQTMVNARDLDHRGIDAIEDNGHETDHAPIHTRDNGHHVWDGSGNTRPGVEREHSTTDLGLDVLDLTSILKFNQAISSELDIDKLLIKMTEIILSSAGSQANLLRIITESEGQWCVAASGDGDSISASVSVLPVV